LIGEVKAHDWNGYKVWVGTFFKVSLKVELKVRGARLRWLEDIVADSEEVKEKVKKRQEYIIKDIKVLLI
jgi:hypothetical protein